MSITILHPYWLLHTDRNIPHKGLLVQPEHRTQQTVLLQQNIMLQGKEMTVDFHLLVFYDLSTNVPIVSDTRAVI